MIVFTVEARSVLWKVGGRTELIRFHARANFAIDSLQKIDYIFGSASGRCVIKSSLTKSNQHSAVSNQPSCDPLPMLSALGDIG